MSTDSLPEKLVSLLPPERLGSTVVLELAPEADFLTYGIGVSLQTMRKPDAARAHVPVSDRPPLP